MKGVHHRTVAAVRGPVLRGREGGRERERERERETETETETNDIGQRKCKT